MNKWTDSDILLLKSCFLIKTKQELVDIFPQRTYLAIWKKAHKLGLTAPDDIKLKNRSIAKTLPKKEKTKNYKGYNLLYVPYHPRADRNGRVFEHIIVWENYHNELVTKDYVIHHINGIKDDNRIENLKKMTLGEHTAHHRKNRKLSIETRLKMSQKALERLKNKKNHPRYKEIDILQLQKEIQRGETVTSVCRKWNINRSTYYKKMAEKKEK